jgi:hypothetical protein
VRLEGFLIRLNVKNLINFHFYGLFRILEFFKKIRFLKFYCWRTKSTTAGAPVISDAPSQYASSNRLPDTPSWCASSSKKSLPAVGFSY